MKTDVPVLLKCTGAVYLPYLPKYKKNFFSAVFISKVGGLGWGCLWSSTS